MVVPYPFTGDQALFETFARMMSDGAGLYRDVWDVKQPGIFWFFGIAGTLFGFHEIGTHIGEALYWVAASVLIAVGLHAHLERRWIAGFFPLVGAGWYFAVAGIGDLTQVESLISPLIVGVALLCADRGGRSPSRAGVLAAGGLTGVVFVFKFLAVLIPAGLFSAVVIMWIRKGRRGTVLRDLIAPFSVGLALIVIPLLAWVFWNDLGDTVRYTWFEYPPEMLRLQARPLNRLINSAGLFFAKYVALVILAVVGLVARSRRRSDLALLLSLAVVLAGLVVGLQLWWGYLLFVAAAPIGALAMLGVDALFASASRRRIIAVVIVVAIAALPAAALGARKVERFAGLVSGESLVEYRMFSASYAAALATARAAEIGENDSIYVLGDPLTMQIPGANQAIPINGWGPEFWTTDMWRAVADQLARTEVAALFIRNDVEDLARQRAPWFLSDIAGNFDVEIETSLGSWYISTNRSGRRGTIRWSASDIGRPLVP